MKKHYLFFSLFILLGAATYWAQQKINTGIVNDENGLPLPGATILIQNTTDGTTTDFDGNFSLQIEEGSVLVISYVGYQNQTVTIGPSDTYTVGLQLGSQLSEDVVTALGISREQKSLGYSVQTIDGSSMPFLNISQGILRVVRLP